MAVAAQSGSGSLGRKRDTGSAGTKPPLWEMKRRALTGCQGDKGFGGAGKRMANSRVSGSCWKRGLGSPASAQTMIRFRV